ncbi:MAG: hypothetical protein OEO23_05295 [Gemmatimonadota bacterium]|nr:hypothetical protein [Gemmatimonadota bacterium]
MTGSLAHRVISALLNAVLFGTFVTVPLLDGVAAEYGSVIESEHGACEYVRIHDHAICVQFGSNSASGAAAPVAFQAIPQTDYASLPPRAESSTVRLAVLRERTRAPPLS